MSMPCAPRRRRLIHLAQALACGVLVLTGCAGPQRPPAPAPSESPSSHAPTHVDQTLVPSATATPGPSVGVASGRPESPRPTARASDRAPFGSATRLVIPSLAV